MGLSASNGIGDAVTDDDQGEEVGDELDDDVDDDNFSGQIFLPVVGR